MDSAKGHLTIVQVKQLGYVSRNIYTLDPVVIAVNVTYSIISIVSDYQNLMCSHAGKRTLPIHISFCIFECILKRLN